MQQVRVSGGGARSPLWRQILADVLGAELVTVNTTEGAAFGAALLAGVGAGVWPNVDEACAQTVFINESIVPNTRAVETYREMYQHYESLYPALKQTFHALGSQ
jgi:xylulokinase